ncbi:contractile injection system protein, VgrG/Pvc8 family [Vibrio parahaemolyticus]|uniref:contractile injection system protein, VgrG/Pvc8 family n=1 Tax=Vibrio parahaemolyticus TaxID=670 RepID=UPI001F33EC9D|nr:contractile injection system protein, VgrG/Pvc8 family [Vibrio parahaemolyticus]UJX32991.1 hypothetical protein JHS79_26580 [Vibrio parahaemolyticus]
MDIINIKGAGAAELKPLLTNWSLTDSEGMQADRLTLTFSGSESQDHIPASGTEWSVIVDGENRGVFQISAISEQLHPAKLVVQLTPAKFSVEDKSGFKEPRRRTFPPATVLDVVKAVMEPHGYEVRVSPELASKPTDHLNQNEETDSAFIARLASKHDAIAKPIDHMYVFGKRGSLSTLSGNAQRSVTINLQDVQKGTAKIAHPSNVRFKGIKAEWQTPETGNSGTQIIGTEPYYRIREVFKNADEATQRAEAKLAEFNRKGQKFTATLNGKQGLFAESVMNLEGFHSPRSKGNWSIETITLSGTRTTYTIQVEATRPT